MGHLPKNFEDLKNINDISDLPQEELDKLTPEQIEKLESAIEFKESFQEGLSQGATQGFKKLGKKGKIILFVIGGMLAFFLLIFILIVVFLFF